MLFTDRNLARKYSHTKFITVQCQGVWIGLWLLWILRKFGSVKQVSMAYARNVAYAKLKYFTLFGLIMESLSWRWWTYYQAAVISCCCVSVWVWDGLLLVDTVTLPWSTCRCCQIPSMSGSEALLWEAAHSGGWALSSPRPGSVQLTISPRPGSVQLTIACQEQEGSFSFAIITQTLFRDFIQHFQLRSPHFASNKGRYVFLQYSVRMHTSWHTGTSRVTCRSWIKPENENYLHRASI